MFKNINFKILWIGVIFCINMISLILACLAFQNYHKDYYSSNPLQIDILEGEYDIDDVIPLMVEKLSKLSSNTNSLDDATVICADIIYPGYVETADSDNPKTILCLFNNRYVMNTTLKRMGNFIEDLIIADEEPNYSDTQWVEDKKTDRIEGYNLESPDIEKYLNETKSLIQNRQSSSVQGIQIENSFLENFLLKKIQNDKPFILLGVFLTSDKEPPKQMEDLISTLGHEIFHSFYFHSSKMRNLVKEFFDENSPEGIESLTNQLQDFGHSIIDKEGNQKKYMIYNEAQAYLLENGAYTDAAFARTEFPQKFSSKLRKLLIDEKIIKEDWASKWSNLEKCK